VIEATLEEAWTSVKPKVNHLKIFGSVAYDDTTCRNCYLLGMLTKGKHIGWWILAKMRLL
jgi:hypothetical protein